MSPRLPFAFFRESALHDYLHISQRPRRFAIASSQDGPQVTIRSSSSTLTGTNFPAKRQLLAVARSTQLPALTGIQHSWNQQSVHLHAMDDALSKNFGSLGLGSNQQPPAQKARRNQRRGEARAKEKDRAQALSQEEAPCEQGTPNGGLSNESNRVYSYQSQNILPSGPSSTPPIHAEAAIPHHVGSDAAPRRYSRDVVAPVHDPSPFQNRPAQDHIVCRSLTAPRQQQQRQRKLQPKAEPFVPQAMPSANKQTVARSFAQVQQTSLFTSVAPRQHVLPTSSRRSGSSLASIGQSSPYSSIPPRANLVRGDNSRKILGFEIRKDPEKIPLPAPQPTKAYLAEASMPPARLQSPQILLIVLDLNHTLLLRTRGSQRYVLRPGYRPFLDYCFHHHKVMIWSSATRPNVDDMCEGLFTETQRKCLLGEWNRDALGLTPEQYDERVQIYKNLDTIWKSPSIQSFHPEYAIGGVWGQHNTILIDDSIEKASAQPFNNLVVPEFEIKIKKDYSILNRRGLPFTTWESTEKEGILAAVQAELEELKTWNNVSTFYKTREDTGGRRLQWGAIGEESNEIRKQGIANASASS